MKPAYGLVFFALSLIGCLLKLPKTKFRHKIRQNK